MEKKTKLITKILLGSAILISSSLLIFESVAPASVSPVYKMTHLNFKQDYANKELTDIHVMNSNTMVVPDGMLHEIQYDINSPYTTDRDVTITSSNPELVTVFGNYYYVLNNGSEILKNKPVEITVASKNNPEIKDSFKVKVETVPVDEIRYSIRGVGLEQETELVDTHVYEAPTNKVLEVNFIGHSYTSANDPTEKISIQVSPNITKLDDSHFYINKNDGNECFIKAYAGTSLTKTIAFKVIDGSPIPQIDKWKLYYGNSSINPMTITPYEIYKIYPTTVNGLDTSIPFIMGSSSEHVHMVGYNSFFVDDETEVCISIYPTDGSTINEFYTSEYSTAEFTYNIVGNRTGSDKRIQVYTNSGFDINAQTTNGPTDFYYEIEDTSVVHMVNNYFVTGEPGETKITYRSTNPNLSDYYLEFEVIVEPDVKVIVFNENIIFGFWHLGLGLLIATFFFMFVINKRYLPLQPISYGIGLVAVSIISLIQLASPFRVITFPLFALNLLMEFISITIFYVGTIIYHHDNGYSLDINQYVPLDHDNKEENKEEK